jgi:hypothetical protein
MRIAFALLPLLLGACTSTPLDTSGPTASGGSVQEEFVGPNGKQGYGLVCGRGLSACFDDARKVCANGFAVVGTWKAPVFEELLVECK